VRINTGDKILVAFLTNVNGSSTSFLPSPDNDNVFSVTGLSKGLYILHAISGTQSFVRKIIVQ
jgi:hypothetical protein